MLGFGELFAHEAAFRLGWGGTKVSFIPGVVRRRYLEVNNGSAKAGTPATAVEDLSLRHYQNAD
jgi:hypothetical protein